MDADTAPVVIHIQLVLLGEEITFHSPIHGKMSIQAGSLVADFLSRLQTVYKNQKGEMQLSGSKSSFPLYHLTSREREIIELLRIGKSHKQIAAELYIASRTVGKHLQNIYEKMGVKSKYEAFIKLAQE